MFNINFQMPRKIEIGFSKIKEIVKIIKETKLQRVLIVVDSNLKKAGVIDYTIKDLKKENLFFSVFDNIKNEPTINEIDKAINDLNVVSKFDGIIGIGGGSTIDTAKLLAVSGSIKGSIRDYIGVNLIKERNIPTIMIPTTSGTGAEATPNAVVKDPVEGWKKGIVSPFLIPDRVIIDPELTISLPSKVTAETGLDAFTHAIECFICNKSNLMSDLFALESIKLVNNYLRKAVKNGNNKEARYYMSIASLYGGIAITNSGTGGVHALAYPLGGKYNLSHGLSNSLLLTEVMRFNSEMVKEKFTHIAKVMGIKKINYSQEEAVDFVLEAISKLVVDVGIRIENFEVSEQIIDELAKLGMLEERLLKNNPRPIKYENARAIYRKSLIIK